MKRLLDTNICIYIIKKKPLEVLERFKAFTPTELGISSITAAELMYGAQKSQRPVENQKAVEQFLLPLMVADFDSDAARCCGQIRAYLERIGKPIGALDLLIAAQALQLDVPVVTNNTREFERIPGLRLENWT